MKKKKDRKPSRAATLLAEARRRNEAPSHPALRDPVMREVDRDQRANGNRWPMFLEVALSATHKLGHWPTSVEEAKANADPKTLEHMKGRA